MFRKFEEITADIGGELKWYAREIYKKSKIYAIILAAVLVVGSIVLAIEEEEISYFFYGCLSAFVEFLIVLTVGYVATIHTYAKGESVHQLTRQTELLQKAQAPAQDQSEPAQSPQLTAAVKAAEEKAAEEKMMQEAVRVQPDKKPKQTTVAVAPNTNSSDLEILSYALLYTTDQGMRSYLERIAKETEQEQIKAVCKDLLSKSQWELRPAIQAYIDTYSLN